MRRLLLFLVLAVVCVGCQSQPPTETQEEPSPLTPAASLSIIQENVEDLRTTHEMLQQDRKSFRVQSFRKNTEACLSSIKALSDDPNSTPEQIQDAYLAKSKILHFAAICCPQEYEQVLADWAKKLNAEQEDSEACKLAIANWLRIQSAKAETDLDQFLEAITEFGVAYPAHESTAELFTSLSRRLVKEKKFAAAKRVLEVAYEVVEDRQALVRARNLYVKQFRLEKKKASDRRAHAQLRGRVKAMLKGQEEGYFVIYAEDTAEKESPRCGYYKLEGLDAVVDFVERMQRIQWKWEVSKAFPYTREGSRHATNHATSMKRRYTTIKFN